MRKTALKSAALLIAGIIALQWQAASADDTPPDTSAKPVVATTPTLPSAAVMDAQNGTPAIPASSWFPILPFDAGSDAEPQLLPVASNHPLEGDHAGITRAIIAIHDVSRDSSNAVAMLTALAGPRGQDTFILAPQFLLESDIAHFALHLPDGGRAMARWAPGAWEDGGNSTPHSPDKGISSFTTIDLLLAFFSDKKFFPDLKEVIITGHGAGGDFVLRYAALGVAPDMLDQDGIKVRFAVANASSYLYFTPMRPLGNKPGFGLPATDHCPNYDVYKYGLETLNDYGRRTGADAIRLRYLDRHVTYLTGETAGQSDPFPDNNCAAMLEGIDRHARAANYDLYLSTIFGDDANKSQQSVAVPGTGYDPVVIYGSACGMNVLFGDGECETTATP